MKKKTGAEEGLWIVAIENTVVESFPQGFIYAFRNEANASNGASTTNRYLKLEGVEPSAKHKSSE